MELLQTKALLLGPSISGANGMLLKDICRQALKEESCHSAPFCGRGRHCLSPGPSVISATCDSHCYLAFALTCLSTSSQTLVFCLLPEGFLTSRMSVLLLVSTP